MHSLGIKRDTWTRHDPPRKKRDLVRRRSVAGKIDGDDNERQFSV
jgi:hypothetical protein